MIPLNTRCNDAGHSSMSQQPSSWCRVTIGGPVQAVNDLDQTQDNWIPDRSYRHISRGMLAWWECENTRNSPAEISVRRREKPFLALKGTFMNVFLLTTQLTQAKIAVSDTFSAVNACSVFGIWLLSTCRYMKLQLLPPSNSPWVWALTEAEMNGARWDNYQMLGRLRHVADYFKLCMRLDQHPCLGATSLSQLVWIWSQIPNTNVLLCASVILTIHWSEGT